MGDTPKKIEKVSSRSTKFFYNRKKELEGKQEFKPYFDLVYPKKDKNTIHLLSSRNAENREDELYEMVRILKELKAVSEKMLDENERIAAEEEQNVKDEKERQGKNIREITNSMRKAITETHSVPEYLTGVEEEYREKLLGILGNDDQIDSYYRTCFKSEILEKKNLEEVLQSEQWKESILNPDLLPEISPEIDPREVLEKTWRKDMSTLKKYYEVKSVRSNMQAMEESALGKEKLAHKNPLDTQGQGFERDITWGKFMEKMMCILLAEYWKDNKKIKVIPVEANLDIYGKIDVLVEVTSTDGRTHSLVGIDYTMQSKTDTTKNMSDSVLVKLDPASAQKTLSKEILDQHPGILEGKSVFIPRKVHFNDVGTRFREAFLEKLYETLKSPVEMKRKLLSSLYNTLRESNRRAESIETISSLAA